MLKNAFLRPRPACCSWDCCLVFIVQTKEFVGLGSCSKNVSVVFFFLCFLAGWPDGPAPGTHCMLHVFLRSYGTNRLLKFWLCCYTVGFSLLQSLRKWVWELWPFVVNSGWSLQVNSRIYQRYDLVYYQSIFVGIVLLLLTKKRFFGGEKVVDALLCWSVNYQFVNLCFFTNRWARLYLSFGGNII